MNKQLVVIGGGPGGYDVAIKAGLMGMDVALIEKEEVGGTCLNWGCIPTKALYKSASILHEMNLTSNLGINVDGINLDFETVQNHKNDVKNQLIKGIKTMLNRANVELIYGDASFNDSNTITVATNNEEVEIKSKYFILATGSTEKILPIEGVDLEGVITSKDLLEINTPPKELIIIGGGVIGLEMGSIFNQFGSEVTVIEYMGNLLPTIDEDISKRIKPFIKKQGIKVNTNTIVKKIEKENNKLVVYAENSKGKELSFEGEKVLLATGRKAYHDKLGLENAGVEFNGSGIVVNENFQTNKPNIYAVGDVLGKIMLAHTATYQSFAALDHINGRHNNTRFDVIPSCVFVFPEIATVGLTEELAREKHQDIKINKFMFRANGKALTMGQSDGFVKVVIDNNEAIIGVHIIGPHASDLIHEATVLVEQKMTVNEAINIIHAHPTLSEALLEALRGFKH